MAMLVFFLPPIWVFDRSGTATWSTTLAGSFDANGVLTGTVNDSGLTGPLSGLIGQDNAVGVFYNSVRWRVCCWAKYES